MNEQNKETNLAEIVAPAEKPVAPTAPEVLDTRTPEQKLHDAYKALAMLQKLKKKKHRGQNAGAFGGKNVGIKRRKKLAKEIERTTVE